MVVTTWRGKAVSPKKQVVMLISLPVEEDAASIAKKYRLRSLIENCGFRELKQAAYLKHLPGRKGENAENAVYLHIMLCVFAHTLFYAFLGWRKKKAPEQSAGDCLCAWRRRESIKEGNKILIVLIHPFVYQIKMFFIRKTYPFLKEMRNRYTCQFSYSNFSVYKKMET